MAHLSWAISGDTPDCDPDQTISCRSPLKFTGLRRGDIVLSVNDHSVQSEKTFKVYGNPILEKDGRQSQTWKQNRNT